MNRYFKIGRIAASFGFKGHVILQHSLGKKTALKGLRNVFLEEARDSFIPYFIESASARQEDEVLLKIDGINSKEETKSILQQEVWLTEDDFNKYSSRSAPISLLGYTLLDGDQIIGEVLEVIEQPHQVLCKVMYKDKEALIPIHQEFLEEINKRKKQVRLNLPEGLLDIYS